MKNNQIHLGSKDILEKDFKMSVRGYNPKDVDAFLDIIMLDYEALNNEIQMLKQENERLRRNDVHEPEVQPQPEIETEPRAKRIVPPQQVNYDVLKRLSNLEKAVFGQKIQDENN